MNELITIKGSSSGLQLVIDNQADFTQVKQALATKLAASTRFFVHNTEIVLKNSSFSSQEHIILRELLQKYHLTLKLSSSDDGNSPDAGGAGAEKAKPQTAQQLPDKIIKRTIRGGEEIIYKGSIVIYGNVNPGATVVAGGNINVHGRCRGIVHAGAFGNHDAFVVADKMMPLQIRIADFIARSPDNAADAGSASFTEMACIKDGNIVLEPFER